MHAIHLILLAMFAWGTGANDRVHLAQVGAGQLATAGGTRAAPAIVPTAPLTDTVYGFVFDSIANAPMVDAFVIAEPGGALTATTHEGRFILVSPARVRKISVFHDATNRLGLSDLVAVRPDPSVPWHNVTVATPSMATIWSRFCSGSRPGGGMGGIVFGSVRGSDDSSRVAGALVTVTWRANRESDGFAQKVDGKSNDGAQVSFADRIDSANVVTDNAGQFVICGVREPGEASVVATSKESQSGTVVMQSSKRSLRRVDLLIGDRDARGVPRTAIVRGRVLDSLGNPVSDASVALDGVPKEHYTNTAGEFVFDSAPTGSRMLTARKVGFRLDWRSIDIPAIGVSNAELVLQHSVVRDGNAAIRLPLTSQEQWEVSARRAFGVGHVMDSTLLARYRNTREVIASLTGFTAEKARKPTRGFTVHSGRDDNARCPATVFVDAALDADGGAAMLQTLAPADIGVVEAYSNPAQAPARFQLVEAAPQCGVLLVWTKSGLRGSR